MSLGVSIEWADFKLLCRVLAEGARVLGAAKRQADAMLGSSLNLVEDHAGEHRLK